MINETLLQQLVDQELTPEQRERFVQSLQGPQWKIVALAFIENQILDEKFPQLADELERPSERILLDERATVQLKTEHYENRQRLWLRVMAVVLIGVVGALIGYQLAAGLGSQYNVVDETTPVGNETKLSLDEALARCSMPIPDDFRLDMLEAGYVVTEAEKVSDVSLPFGGTVKIPIRKVNVEYRGFDTFQ